MPTPVIRPRTERINVTLPNGFDESKHMASLRKKITDAHGSGWEIDSLDLAAGKASASRQVEVTQVEQTSSGGRDSIQVKLPRTTKPSDGDKTAAKLEASYDGYTLTQFEPFLGYAVMEKLSAAAIRARGALAVALGVKPWDVQIADTVSGGFAFTLPRTYVPSKHDDKMQEVAEAIVGREGWFVRVNPQELTGEIVPSSPPTFPPVLSYPFDAPIPRFDAAAGDWARIPIGERLPRLGSAAGEPLMTDFLANPMMQISGVARSRAAGSWASSTRSRAASTSSPPSSRT